MEDNKLITLDIPLEESKQGVFSAYLNIILTYANILGAQTSDTDNRVNELVDILISVLPNLKKQQQLREKRDERIEKETKGITINEDRGKVIRKINREILGEVSAYMDIYQGGERKNRISFIIPQKEMRELMQKANPEHFIEHLSDLGEKK